MERKRGMGVVSQMVAGAVEQEMATVAGDDIWWWPSVIWPEVGGAGERKFGGFGVWEFVGEDEGEGKIGRSDGCFSIMVGKMEAAGSEVVVVGREEGGLVVPAVGGEME
ncbi:hypothetical protein HAX54_040474 [Datura stramonium]|uniref:Uncharacterized protein n=1 Tax=Datura stramonium TaxID=4076 RepID=A0ABS8VNY9_DATST|nr:hypothetical protein [Datura stramonium]